MPKSKEVGLNNACADSTAEDACIANGGECLIKYDGFFVEVGICLVVGILWYLFMFKKVTHLQRMKSHQWKVKQKKH